MMLFMLRKWIPRKLNPNHVETLNNLGTRHGSYSTI